MEIPLSRLGIGKIGTIKFVRGGSFFHRRMFSLGIRIGKKVRVLCCHPLGGPIVVEVDNMRIAIGRGMASRIIVKTDLK